MPRSLRPTSRGQIRTPPAIEVRDGKVTQTSLDDFNAYHRELHALVVGGLSFGDGENSTQAGNFSAQWITEIVSPNAGTEFIVTHALGRKPVGYLVTFVNKSGAVIYATGHSNFNTERLYLKSSENATTFDLLVF